ncbi:Flagellar L-ring protein [Thermodesulfobacterium geofontis OPF15]|uniref:Flagellar L-ring protein n=1 Tax=Thermodesulfobacterium geofontis (strain OPF15) TaxID=795359 RepID=F8C3T0_THEGP|nr:flagellar basal body L-ring protein FlgH [Thermodesulfobacterium geofontis]AEH23647.1 Flagellar L-ring protein [Thermodesulfobacterium geofontis OPF15]
MIKKYLKFLTILSSFFFIYGCFEYNPKTPPPPPPPPSVDIPYEIPQALSKGSLYKDGAVSISFSDLRARQVGDIVTIKIVETYSTSSSVKQQTAKKSSAKAGIDKLMGFENRIEGIFKDATPSDLFEGSLSTSTTGQGGTSRESKILATMTARVIKVLPNGNLVIQGTRAIKKNNDLEYITLTGIIRPEDIGYDNSILSTQISDAYIEYSGKGPTSEVVSGPGIITRLLHIFWPF